LHILTRRATHPAQELQAVLGDYELPSFPALLLKALEKVRDDEASDADIASLVSADPGFSVRLLTTVNSAAFSLMHKVSNVDHAVSLLGRGELESLLISIAVRQVLPCHEGADFDVRRFWHTATRRAATAKGLADRIDPSTRSESFTAGLLQDMAIPVLMRCRAHDYGPVLACWHSGGGNLATLERETFAWDHAMVAKWMCDKWQFPERIAQAIGAHHGTGGDEMATLPAVSLVALLGEEEDVGVEQLIESAYSDYGLAREQTAELVASRFASADEIARMFT
jgi:HD-like signal output (HDOD) protein